MIPPAARTARGYRVYTDDHGGALAAYVALVPGYGYRAAGEIMRLVLRGDSASSAERSWPWPAGDGAVAGPDGPGVAARHPVSCCRTRLSQMMAAYVRNPISEAWRARLSVNR